MKRLTRLDDIPYSIEIRGARPPGSPPRPGALWERRLVLLAPVVGSDGFVREEEHVVEFGELSVTKRSVTARWAHGSLLRPDEPEGYDDKRKDPRAWEMREVILPRINNRTASRKLTFVRDRLVKVLAPQHSWLFRLVDAMDFCQMVHNHVIVSDVMGS